MIESIYVNEKDSGFCHAGTRVGMPRNVRQIGKSNGTFGIYIEDYVVTFARKLSEKHKNKQGMAVLLGKESKKNTGTL